MSLANTSFTTTSQVMARTVIATIATIAALVMTIPLAVSARPGGMDRAPDPGHMVERMSKRLDLSAGQEEQILAILEGAMGDSEADHERLEELRSQIKDGGEFDAAAAQEAAAEIGEITTRLVYRRASIQASVSEVLTQEQREAFEALESKRGFRGKGHGGAGHKPAR